MAELEPCTFLQSHVSSSVLYPLGLYRGHGECRCLTTTSTYIDLASSQKAYSSRNEIYVHVLVYNAIHHAHDRAPMDKVNRGTCMDL